MFAVGVPIGGMSIGRVTIGGMRSGVRGGTLDRMGRRIGNGGGGPAECGEGAGEGGEQ